MVQPLISLARRRWRLECVAIVNVSWRGSLRQNPRVVRAEQPPPRVCSAPLVVPGSRSPISAAMSTPSLSLPFSSGELPRCFSVLQHVLWRSRWAGRARGAPARQSSRPCAVGDQFKFAMSKSCSPRSVLHSSLDSALHRARYRSRPAVDCSCHYHSGGSTNTHPLLPYMTTLCVEDVMIF